MKVCAARNVEEDFRTERVIVSMNLGFALVQATKQRHVTLLAVQVNLFN